MIRLLFTIIFLLVCSPGVHSQSWFFGGATCTTGSADISQATGTDEFTVSGTVTSGQDFKPTATKSLYSIKVYISAVNTSGDFAMRVGTTADLSSSYLAQSSTLTISSTGLKEFLFTSHPSLTASTTYYYAWVATAGGSVNSYRTTSGVYGDGVYRYGTTTKYVLDGTQSKDARFEVDLCAN